MARTVVALGLLLFAGAVGTGDHGWLLAFWRVDLALVAAATWALAALVGAFGSNSQEQTIDFVIGLACLGFGVLSLFGTTDEWSSDVFAEIAGALLVLGAVGLIMASAASKRRADRWRNTEDV